MEELSLKTIRCLLLIIVSILFISTAFLLQAAIVIETRLADPQFYASVAGEVSPGMAVEITREMTAGRPPLLQNVVVGAVSDIFPEDWFARQVDVVLSADDGNEAAAIDLSERKAALTEELTRILQRRTPRELAAMGMSLAQVETVVEEMVAELDLPDEMTVNDLFSLDNPESQQKLDKLQGYRNGLKYIPAVGMVIFGAAIFFLTGPARGLRWTGGSLFTSAAAFLAGYYIFKNHAASALTSYLEPLFKGPLTFLEAGTAAQALMNAADGAFVITALSFAAAGFLLFLAPAAFALLKKKRPVLLNKRVKPER